MEAESFNTKISPLNLNNKYIEYINKDDISEKLTAQINEKIKNDIINQLNLKFDNINKNFNDKLEEIKKYIDKAMKMQLENIFTYINKNNDNENLNTNINNENIIVKANEDNKGIKNKAKYKRLNIGNYQSNKNNDNSRKKIIVNHINNNTDIINSNLLNRNQNNIIERKVNDIHKDYLNTKYNEEKLFKKRIYLGNEMTEKGGNKTTNFIRGNNNFYISNNLNNNKYKN